VPKRAKDVLQWVVLLTADCRNSVCRNRVCRNSVCLPPVSHVYVFDEISRTTLPGNECQVDNEISDQQGLHNALISVSAYSSIRRNGTQRHTAYNLRNKITISWPSSAVSHSTGFNLRPYRLTVYLA